jgi:hypothetical protein
MLEHDRFKLEACAGTKVVPGDRGRPNERCANMHAGRVNENPIFGDRDRQAALIKYHALAAAVSQAIDAADPMGLLEMGCPADEYSPEIGTITPRVAKAATSLEVRAILQEEFERWFGAESAGPVEAFDEPAAAIWQAVLAFRLSQ